MKIEAEGGWGCFLAVLIGLGSLTLLYIVFMLATLGYFAAIVAIAFGSM